MKKSLLLITIILSTTLIYAWDIVSKKKATLETIDAPNLQLNLSNKSFLLGQPINMRFILINPHNKELCILPYYIIDPLDCGGLTIKIIDHKKKVISPYHWTSGNLYLQNYLLMTPHEQIIKDYILSYKILTEGIYTIKSYYSWRGAKSLNPPDWDSVAKAKDITFQVISPTGVDKEVFDYVNDIEMLYCLQDYNMVMTPKDSKKLDLLKMKVKKTEMASFIDKYFSDEHDKIQNMRKYIINKYPKSSYVRNMLFSYAMDYKIYKQFNKAIESYQEFVKRYPTSWFVDEALFNIAECQIELGQLDEAKKTIEKVLHMEADGNIQLKAKRIKRNLAKGYKTLDEIYSH